MIVRARRDSGRRRKHKQHWLIAPLSSPPFIQPITRKAVEQLRLGKVAPSDVFILVLRSVANMHAASLGVPWEALIQVAQAINLARKLGVPLGNIEIMIVMRIAALNPKAQERVSDADVALQAARHYAVAQRILALLRRMGARSLPIVSFDPYYMGTQHFDQAIIEFYEENPYTSFQTGVVQSYAAAKRRSRARAVVLKIGATAHEHWASVDQDLEARRNDDKKKRRPKCEACFDRALYSGSFAKLQRRVAGAYTHFAGPADINVKHVRWSSYQVNEGEIRVLLNDPAGFVASIEATYPDRDVAGESSYRRAQSWVCRLDRILDDVYQVRGAFSPPFEGSPIPREFVRWRDIRKRQEAKLLELYPSEDRARCKLPKGRAEAVARIQRRLWKVVYPNYYRHGVKLIRDSLRCMGEAFVVTDAETADALSAVPPTTFMKAVTDENRGNRPY